MLFVLCEPFQIKMLYVFYHIFCNENAPEIVRDQISKLHFSGVYKRCDAIYCFLLGPHPDPITTMLTLGGAKFRLQKQSLSDPCEAQVGERFTLTAIAKLIEPDDKFLYLHSKGVTRPNNERVRAWRELMEYHLMTGADECIAALDTCDVVGCNYRHWHLPLDTAEDDDNAPLSRGRHFSGNMWWCRGAYWLSLPPTIDCDYFGPEMHIGLRKPRFKNLYECHVDNYWVLTPLASFVD